MSFQYTSSTSCVTTDDDDPEEPSWAAANGGIPSFSTPEPVRLGLLDFALGVIVWSVSVWMAAINAV